MADLDRLNNLMDPMRRMEAEEERKRADAPRRKEIELEIAFWERMRDTLKLAVEFPSTLSNTERQAYAKAYAQTLQRLAEYRGYRGDDEFGSRMVMNRDVVAYLKRL